MRRSLFKLLAPAALLLALTLPTSALAQGRQPLVVTADQHLAGSVSTVSEDIRVEGTVEGDVTSWSGAITIAGSVAGDVVSYGGAVTVTATGHVGGHVLASGGPLRLEPGAVVAGRTISGDGRGALASLLDLFVPSAGPGGVDPLARALLAIVLGVLLLAFCAVGGALWPRRVAIAGASLARLPGRALAVGALTTLVLGLALLPLTGVLVASVVGLPLLLLVLAIALAPYVYGLTVLARALSEWLAARTGRGSSYANMTVSAAALVVPLALVGMAAPPWGLALFYLLASPGLGAAILSRGGMALPVSAR